MDIFRRLLLPVSSEFFSEDAVRRAKKFVDVFGSEIYVVYIPEEKAIKKMEEVSEPFLTENQRERMEEVVRKLADSVGDIIFDNMKKIIPLSNKEVRFGEFSDVIEEISEREGISCIVMGFERECFIKYRLLEKITMPVWVEEGKGSTVVGACSNLAPNLKVPSFTMEFAEKMGEDACLLYIIDTSEKVEVDERGNKLSRDMEELRKVASSFKERYKEKIRVEIVEGDMKEEIAKFAGENDADVVIIGREMKRRGFFSRELRKGIVERAKHSILFLN